MYTGKLQLANVQLCLIWRTVTLINIVISDALVELVDNEGHPMTNQYYNPGSEIELACIIRNRSLWSTEVQWLKDDEPVDLHHRPFVRYGSNLYSFSIFRQPNNYY